MGFVSPQNPQTRHTTKAYLCPAVDHSSMVWPRKLPKVLKPLLGKSPHRINSTHDFVEQVKQLTLSSGECLSSYDVSALFTSVPGDPA